jgi:hypothetical protein
MGPQNMTGGGSKQCRIPATQTWAVAWGVGKKIKSDHAACCPDEEQLGMTIRLRTVG